MAATCLRCEKAPSRLGSQCWECAFEAYHGGPAKDAPENFEAFKEEWRAIESVPPPDDPDTRTPEEGAHRRIATLPSADRGPPGRGWRAKTATGGRSRGSPSRTSGFATCGGAGKDESPSVP